MTFIPANSKGEPLIMDRFILIECDAKGQPVFIGPRYLRRPKCRALMAIVREAGL